MNSAEFDFHLPESSIAQQPLPDRAASRMLVLDRQSQTWRDDHFRNFPSYLAPEDQLVLNDTRVFPSRLFGHLAGTATEVEVFLLHPNSEPQIWQALVKPGRKIRPGTQIEFASNLTALVTTQGEFGERTLVFNTPELLARLTEIGHVPLPPYIKRPDTESDRERYQTVFARHPGSVAAPTAGLHFTPEVLNACAERGAQIDYITLHVGLGTFQPVRDGKLHSERFYIAPETEARIRSAERVLCVGTTSVRAVESALLGLSGETSLFIQPGFAFQRVNAMLTNFHLPQSSLLMLVCAFAGKDFVLSAYRHAVASGYRFYSYGDSMLIF